MTCIVYAHVHSRLSVPSRSAPASVGYGKGVGAAEIRQEFEPHNCDHSTVQPHQCSSVQFSPVESSPVYLTPPSPPTTHHPPVPHHSLNPLTPQPHITRSIHSLTAKQHNPVCTHAAYITFLFLFPLLSPPPSPSPSLCSTLPITKEYIPFHSIPFRPLHNSHSDYLTAAALISYTYMYPPTSRTYRTYRANFRHSITTTLIRASDVLRYPTNYNIYKTAPIAQQLSFFSKRPTVYTTKHKYLISDKYY